MDTERRLSPRELRWAIDHAWTTHRLAEEQRERAAGCTSLADLRAVLLESGLPAADVYAALETLDEALTRRRRAARQRRRGLLVFGGGFAVAAVAGYLLSSGAAAGPTVFVNLRHEQPGRQAFSSWEQGQQLDGAAEQELANALVKVGLPVLEQLDAKQLRRLFVGAGVEPSLEAIRAATPATLAALGEARCVQIGGAATEGVKEMRVMLSLQVLRLGSGESVVRTASEGKGAHSDLREACTQAARAAARAVAPGFAAQVAAQAGVPAGQE